LCLPVLAIRKRRFAANPSISTPKTSVNIPLFSLAIGPQIGYNEHISYGAFVPPNPGEKQRLVYWALTPKNVGVLNWGRVG
jgi:hypothetical protein